MKEFNFYRVNQQYLYYLNQSDHTVSIKGNRPFIAISLNIAGQDYAIPITSKMRRDNGARRNTRTTTELIDQNGNELGALLYNNMIPVDNRDLIPIIFDNESPQDKSSFEAKYQIIRKNQNAIKSKASKVYSQRISGRDSFLNSFCSDYKLLETQCAAYHSQSVSLQNNTPPQTTQGQSTSTVPTQTTQGQSTFTAPAQTTQGQSTSNSTQPTSVLDQILDECDEEADKHNAALKKNDITQLFKKPGQDHS